MLEQILASISKRHPTTQGRPMTTAQIVSAEIDEFKNSDKLAIMKEANEYYLKKSAIQKKFTKVKYRSNTKIEHPILWTLIKQKLNFLLSKPFSITSKNKEYQAALNEIFTEDVRDTILAAMSECLKSGRAFIMPCIDGEFFNFKVLKAMRSVPLWKDEDEKKLDALIYFYEQVEYIGTEKKVVTKAEFWNTEGVEYYSSTDTKTFSLDERKTLVEAGNTAMNWHILPIAPIKYGEDGLPLQFWLKELIDDYNYQASAISDNLKDIANFVYVLRGYGGTDLEKFASEVNNYRVINVDDPDGGVDKLELNVDITGAKTLIDKNKSDIFTYGDAVDTTEDSLGNASGVAIKFKYTGLENDCAGIGRSIESAIKYLKPIIDTFLEVNGKGKFEKETFDITFNTDLPVNEGDVIENIRNSEGIVSRSTQLEQHPWVKDVGEELKQLNIEQSEEDYIVKANKKAKALSNGQE